VARTVSVKLLADVSQFTREVGGRAVGATRTLQRELDRTNKRGKLDQVTMAAGLGLSLVGVGRRGGEDVRGLREADVGRGRRHARPGG
jgi:hypothetical protein